MSSTFIKGLGLLDVLDRMGPLTVTELARHAGVDKTAVSRMVSACSIDGWVVKVDRKVALGPRCALLGRRSVGSDVVRQAVPLVHAIAGATGLLTQSIGLVGSAAVALASASGRYPNVFPDEGMPSLLHVTAAGRAIAAQLTPAQLDAALPPEPFPNSADFVAALGEASAGEYLAPFSDVAPVAGPNRVAETRAELDRQLDRIRRDGASFDRGDLHPTLACIAVPWRHPSLPAAFACVGTPADVTAGESQALRCLTAATRPGATPEDVIAAAVAPSR